MNAKKKGLGRGLSALLSNQEDNAELLTPEAAEKMPTGVAAIPIDKIETNPFQPRTEFDGEALEELAESIRTLGIIQPISVRKMDNGMYQLISGERRFRASQMAGLTEIPAYVRTANDQGMLEMAIVENIQRENLNAIEVALSFKRLAEECNLTQEKLSERVAKKRSTITNYLRLLKLPVEIQLGIQKNIISMGHARALINLPDEAKQLKVFNKIIEEGLSVRAVEDLVRKLSENKTKTTGNKPPGDDKHPYESLVEKLVDFFQTNVEIKEDKKGGGKITLSYSSPDDLNRILKLIEK
jgi:ParB family chromosome partitioning protein